MTVICYDGKELVADSSMSTSEIKLPGNTKKIFTPEPDEYWEINGTKVVAFGFSGMLGAIPYVRELLQKGVSYRSVLEPEYDVEFEVICVLEEGSAYILSTGPNRGPNSIPGKHDTWVLPANVPVAVGSGVTFALGAMEVSQKSGNALRGVKAAIRLCPFCGGDPVIWELPQPPETPSKRPVGIPTETITDDSRISDMTVAQLKQMVSEMINNDPIRAIPALTKSEELVCPVTTTQP